VYLVRTVVSIVLVEEYYIQGDSPKIVAFNNELNQIFNGETGAYIINFCFSNEIPSFVNVKKKKHPSVNVDVSNSNEWISRFFTFNTKV